MNKKLSKGVELIGYVRQSILKLTEGLSNDQLNHIPECFKNNLAWNMGHMVFTQQMLCYQSGGLSPTIDMSFFVRFAPGTLPARSITEEEVAKIRAAFLESFEQMVSDMRSGVFDTYQGWTLPSGIVIDGVDDALLTSLVHEGRHFGIMIALSKLVAEALT